MDIKFFCLSLETPQRKQIFKKNKLIIPSLKLLHSVNGYNKLKVLELLKKLGLMYINIEFKTFHTFKYSNGVWFW